MICSVIFDTFLSKKSCFLFPKISNNLDRSNIEKGVPSGEKYKKKRRLILQTSYQGQRRPPFPCPREFNRGWNVLELGRDPPLPPAPPSPLPPIDAVIANLGCGLQWRRTGRKGFRIPKGESRNLLSRVPPTRS